MSPSDGQIAPKDEKRLSGSVGRIHFGSHFGSENYANIGFEKKNV